MKKNRIKRWFAAGSMILVILTALFMLSQNLHNSAGTCQGIYWEMLGYELMFLAGGYGLAAVMMGKIKKRNMRKDVLSHVG